MTTFRAGKLARKKNGHFQSTAVKSRTENVLDSRKRKSSDSLADAIKVSFQSKCESESESVPSGRRVVELGLLSKELADGCNYCRSPLQLSNWWKETLSGLGSFLYITLLESFHQQKRASGDLLVRSENWLFSPKRGWWPIILHNFILLLLLFVKKNFLKKFTSEKKSYREKCIRSHHSWTQNCLLGITHPRNICNQCLFTSCAGVIKQTLNYSFSTIQYSCFVISSILFHISSHHNVENNREKFKENLTTTSITEESP